MQCFSVFFVIRGNVFPPLYLLSLICRFLFAQTKGEKPELFIDIINIQSVEEVDDGAFGQALCFQVWVPLYVSWSTLNRLYQ